MDILTALEKIGKGEDATAVAEELGVEIKNVDLKDDRLLEFAAADELAAGRQKWGTSGPTGGGAAATARKLLAVVASKAPRFTRTSTLDKAIGGRRATVQRVKNMLLGSGHLGEVRPKGKKRMTYVLTPKGLEFIRTAGVIDQNLYNKVKGMASYTKAAQIGARIAARHKVKPSPKQKQQASLQKMIAGIISTSPAGQRAGTSVGTFGVHRKKGAGGKDNFSITVSGKKVGAKWFKSPQLFFGTRAAPPSRRLKVVDRNVILSALTRAGLRVVGDIRVLGYQADSSKPDDIIIGFEAIQATPAGAPSTPTSAAPGAASQVPR